jgi:DNA polymerase III delta prime subunit
MLAEIIVEQELLCRSQWVTTREQYLPPASHDVLFGFESAQQLLSARLRQPSTPWLFVLSGLGGSGKTALAQCLARDAIAHFSFSQFNWIEIDEADTAHVVALSPTAQRRWIAQRLCDEWQLAPAPDEDVIDVAYARLKAQPHLIVIDHVPAGLSTADLADQLLQWANPSKFIVTTRRFGTAPASACAFTMPALDRAAAIALIRHDAEARELLGLADAPDDAYDLIYDVVGGHPAALKLIVALAERLPMAALLDDFTQARLSRVADLFDDVFAAAWAALSPEARTILWQCRTAAAAGLTVEQIVARAEVPSAAVPQAIDELVTVSLIRPNGSAWEKRYVVAPLTRLYLDAVLFALQD